MHRGLEASFDGFAADTNESAPLSADFSLPDSRPAHQTPIRFKNGLVDPTPLLEYMGQCYCGEVSTHLHRDHMDEYHHLYFPIKQFKNNVTPLPIRQLRNSRYNQFLMLSCQEDTYHQQVRMEVPLEEIEYEAAVEFMKADVSLTEFAATSWLIGDIESARRDSRLLSNGSRAKLASRLELLSEIQQEQSQTVNKIEVIDSSVVRGALTRYLQRRPEQGMQEFLDAYHPDDRTLLPTKIHKEHGLKNMAERKLDQRIKMQSWVVQRLLNPSIAST